MKPKTISMLLVVTLAALACLYLDDFSLSNSTAEASWGREEYNGRDYPEAVTVTIMVDGLAIRLFERKIRECIPYGFDEQGFRVGGIPTGELFDRVYESLSEKAKEIYDRDEADAMTDIALDNLGEDRVIEYDVSTEQWKYVHRSEYRMKHSTES